MNYSKISKATNQKIGLRLYVLINGKINHFKFYNLFSKILNISYHVIFSVYTPFTFKIPEPPTTDLLGLDDPPLPQEHISEVFLFEYGVIVIWGMKEEEEKNLLHELVPFEDEKLGGNYVHDILFYCFR